jgi:predicted Zn-ribbon and HTH transcriptional regulator
MSPVVGHSSKEEVPLTRPKWEVADIIRLHAEQYCHDHLLPLSHLKVMHSIQVCRTAYLGGHVEQCTSCGFERHAYNSCRNRHCPKCQALTKAQWLEDRKAELLPVGYFHTVFTIPHELNPIALRNKKAVYTILFKAASETLIEFGKNNLGGQLGFLAILHTWDQKLLDHFHMHCVVAGGALSSDKNRWIAARGNSLFSVKALSIVFRAKFTGHLIKAFLKGDLIFPGNISMLADEKEFLRFVNEVKQKNWVVYCKKPFAGPQQVLDYIGRYTHRVAISNHRIVNIKNSNVTFTYRDRRSNNTLKSMTLQAQEFIRRFLLHVLPDGFVRIRHFGFLANRYKKDNIQHCREIIGCSEQLPETADKTYHERMLDLTGIDITLCPCCKKGSMVIIEEVPEQWKRKPQCMDTS